MGVAKTRFARLVRIVAVLIVAVGSGAWLTLAQLAHLSDAGREVEPSVNGGAFLIVVGVSVIALVALAGWHALWLIPVGTWAFSEIYVRWFWDEVPGVGTSMDYIAYDPRGSMFFMILVMPFAAFVALLRWDIRGR